MTDIVFFWNPETERIQTIELGYFRVPPQLDISALFSRLGRPNKVLMSFAPTELASGYGFIIFFPSSGAVVKLHAVLRDWRYLCLTSDELQEMDLLYLAKDADPVAWARWISYPLFDSYGDPREYLGIGQEELIDLLEQPGGCVEIFNP